jgi:imidazolonepropionase-like amidohydrolase
MNKLDATLGTLEAGKIADVVLVDGNPVEDIFALEKVTATWVEGKKLF